jgi:hypothetical protein
MPLQNRVAPDGSLHAVAARGTMLGNRGGKFHRDDQTLGKRRWASRHWICCELHYKDMHHEAMGNGYTSLFFLDEVTALAAGHRPCFFCRRKEAKAFVAGESVESFDRRVHEERTAFERAETPPPGLRPYSPTLRVRESALPWREAPGEYPRSGGGGVSTDSVWPDGTMIEVEGIFLAKRGPRLLRWSFDGYTSAIPFNPAMQVRVLTPPSILAILARGYQPRWHPSALQWDNT